MELDVLEFWHGSFMRYLMLSIMARDPLTIPVSIVALESAFSLRGKTISPARNALKPMIVQALVCPQDWKRTEYDTTLIVDDDLMTVLIQTRRLCMRMRMMTRVYSFG